MAQRTNNDYSCPISQERYESSFLGNEAYHVCENQLYTLLLCVSTGDELQGTIYTLIYCEKSGNDRRTISTLLTRRELACLTSQNDDVEVSSMLATLTTLSLDVRIFQELDDIPAGGRRSIFITECDRMELGRIANQVFNDIDTMQHVMRGSRYESVLPVSNVHVLRVLLHAYRRWMNVRPHCDTPPSFAGFLQHSGLTIGNDVDTGVVRDVPLTTVVDISGKQVHPCNGWFVHNAICERCSATPHVVR